ncbi:DNA-protecting protein DprA [Patescibacteria group bacterium]|nr:MAG: DNA-protecting protein DprA [Patescibacteria group bacterium]
MDKKFFNAFSLIPGVGPQKIKVLLSFFDSIEAAWSANRQELLQSGLSEALVEKIETERKNINPDIEWEKLERAGVTTIELDSPHYPVSLREITHPPFLLYLKSANPDFDFNLQPAIAIVGSRKITAYGQQAAYRLASDLAKAGLTVVSGLALGVDAVAHRGALDAGGRTIAVLGSSVEDSLVGPRTNFQLSREMLSTGCLVSELPLGVSANPGTFPARNRLMAGMTLGTVVIEAAVDSGSLITAKLAVEFNREVFAVPGSIFSPVSEGTHQLIKAGAKLVTGVADILSELQIGTRTNSTAAKQTIPATLEEEKLLRELSHEPVHVDTLIKITTLGASAVSGTLAILEMKGLVKNVGGQNYIIV